MLKLKTWVVILAAAALPAVAFASGSCPCGDECGCKDCKCNH